MNGKLFLFGIGGTGARVIKSLLMLAGAGVKIDTTRIVPIIVDPDTANANLNDMLNSLKTYQMLHKTMRFDNTTKNEFFKLDLEQLQGRTYQFTIGNTKNGKFSDYINYPGLSQEDKALASLLFSKKNLDSDMQVGFKGNPNVGSVVLNQFSTSQDFIQFASEFNPGDRVFIISSIFGGTGASGFPLLVKTLRELQANAANLQNTKAISHASIGAVSVLPYFDVQPDGNSAIDSSTFIGKAKAALHYYDHSITGNQSVNVMYYLGDATTKAYENSEGGMGQKNDAHFIELAAAQAIIDFVGIPDAESADPQLSVHYCAADANGRIYAPNGETREFGIDNSKATNPDPILFEHLGNQSKLLLCKPLTATILLQRYLEKMMNSEALTKPWAQDLGLTINFFNSPFYQKYTEHLASYKQWLDEMSRNSRSFAPLVTDVADSQIFDLVKGYPAAGIKEMWALKPKGYDLITASLNRNYPKLPQGLTTEQKFAELMYRVMDEIVSKKYYF